MNYIAYLDDSFRLGSLKRCELARNGRGPTEGHCRFCNRRIEDTKRELAACKKNTTVKDSVEVVEPNSMSTSLSFLVVLSR
jgi:hypothetical protein